MPWNEKTGEWEPEQEAAAPTPSADPTPEEFEAIRRRLQMGNANADELLAQLRASRQPPPQAEPVQQPAGEYSPTSEQEFRRASMANNTQPAEARAVTPEEFKRLQPQPPRLPQIFNRVAGPPDAQGNFAYQEDTRGPVNFRPFEEGSASGTIEGSPQESQMRDAYFRRRELFPQESPQQTQAMLAAERQGIVAPDFNPDGVLAQIQNRIAQTDLSHAEQMTLTRLDNGAQSVLNRMNSGAISREAGMAMLQQINSRAMPYRVRRSQLPLLRQQLQIQGLRIRQAEQVARMAAHERFLAEDSPQTVMRDGVLWQRNGRNWVAVPQNAQPRPEREAVTPQIRNNIAASAGREVAAEIRAASTRTAAARRTDPEAPEVRPAFIERMNADPAFLDQLRRLAPAGTIDTTNVGAMGELYRRYLVEQRVRDVAPQEQGQPGGATQPVAQPAPPSNSSQQQAVEQLTQLLGNMAARRVNPPSPALQPPPSPATPQRRSPDEIALSTPGLW